MVTKQQTKNNTHEDSSIDKINDALDNVKNLIKEGLPDKKIDVDKLESRRQLKRELLKESKTHYQINTQFYQH